MRKKKDDLWVDPIVEEVRAARQQLFEEAGGTIESFCDYIRKSQARHGDRLVNLSPRRLEASAPKSKKQGKTTTPIRKKLSGKTGTASQTRLNGK